MTLQLGEHEHNQQVYDGRDGDDGGGEVRQDPGRAAEAPLEVGRCGEEHVPVRRKDMLNRSSESGENAMKTPIISPKGEMLKWNQLEQNDVEAPYHAQSIEIPNSRKIKYSTRENSALHTDAPSSPSSDVSWRGSYAAEARRPSVLRIRSMAEIPKNEGMNGGSLVVGGFELELTGMTAAAGCEIIISMAWSGGGVGA